MSNPRPWFVRIASFIPSWMQNRPVFQTFSKTLFVWALACDQAIQATQEAVFASWPGYDARTDNASIIGACRQLFQGETETPAHFFARARAYLTTALDMGGDVGLALQLWNYIAGNPQIRVISRNGLFTTVAPDGTVTQTQGTWDWDSVCSPERASFWWDYWIVVYPTTADTSDGYYVEDVGTWGDSLVSGETPSGDLGWGHTCTRIEVGVITTIMQAWKGQHVNMKCIIWSNGDDYYAPVPISGSPDGTWGLAFDKSTNVPTRNSTDNFWDTGRDFSYTRLSA